MSYLVDTHCHIQSAVKNRGDLTAKKWQEAGETNPDEVVNSAKEAGINKLICVGTDPGDSKDAVDFVGSRDDVWASIGVHPHEAKVFLAGHKDLEVFKELVERPKIVALGEAGLDYYYEHSPKNQQIKLLEMFLDLAEKTGLPVIFHVRDAFDDFWPVLANFGTIRGVLHSYTSTKANLDKALGKGLYIGLNGIMTFTKEAEQLAMAKQIPLDRLMVETDAPYLAPKPFRGKVCKPEHVKVTAEFLSGLRSESMDEFSVQTSKNAEKLFKIN